MDVATPHARRKRWRLGRASKVVRRIHLYAGLLMFPWLLFFGISGMSFNHPNVGEHVEASPLPAAVVREHVGLEPWDPRQVAASIVARMNEAGSDRYILDDDFAPSIEGVVVLGAPAPDGRYMVLLDPNTASGVLVHRHARPSDGAAPFAQAGGELGPYSTGAIEAGAHDLVAAQGREQLAQLRAHPKIAPESRFRVRDESGEAWNVIGNLGTGEISGRRAEHQPNLGITQFLGALHTTHHYTAEMGPLWWWAFFEDVLGLTMVLWSLTGLWMWWQMKPTRVIGATGVAVALLLAAWAMQGTASHLMFGDVAAVTGPGG